MGRNRLYGAAIARKQNQRFENVRLEVLNDYPSHATMATWSQTNTQLRSDGWSGRPF